MPIYEYRCEKGHTFEVMQRINDGPVTTCQTCDRPVQRVFHPIAVHFKGKGFYNTDYGTRNRQRELAAAGEGSSKAEKSDSSKSESGTSESGKSETSKSETSKSEGSKSDSAKADSGKTSSADSTKSGSAKSKKPASSG